MAVAGVVFIYGLLLLAYGTSKDLLLAGSVPDIERWDHIKQMNTLVLGRNPALGVPSGHPRLR